jgi:arabinogalactan oligomer/maltooligosaccharide transport system permease protein
VLGRDTRVAYLYILPALLVMATITFYPLVYQTAISFFDVKLPNVIPGHAKPADFVGLDNYLRILRDQLGIPNFHFVQMLAFNIWWALSNVVLHIVIGVGIAVILNTRGLRFRSFYRAIYILPVVIPPIIVATVWRNMFDSTDGAINAGPGLPGRLVTPDRRSNLVHPAAARLLRAADGEYVAGLAAQLGRRHRRPAEHPRRAV